MRQKATYFQITVTGGDDGQVEAVYVYFRNTKVVKTREVVEDTVLAHYDSRRNLVGIEILGPAEIRVLVNLVDQGHRAEFRRFARESIPRRFVRQAA